MYGFLCAFGGVRISVCHEYVHESVVVNVWRFYVTVKCDMFRYLFSFFLVANVELNLFDSYHLPRVG